MADQKLNVILGVDSSRFNASLGKAQGRLKAFGSKLKSVGSTLSTRLSLPLALAGGAAIKMAVDFDKSMTQIKTLVGIAGDEVDAMGLKVKQLASQTGKSSTEAAEALFFITSAGLRGAEAMEVLEQSLKGSALGLGETKVVADLATSAMNAYGSDVLSASNATDVLTSSVREGKLSADSLAGAMGMVLPIASSLGVSFNEVGATFAAMSRTGTEAAVASTQLKGILLALLKPSKQARETLNGFGLSAEGLRKQIRDEGLLSTLKTLTTAFGDNEEAQALVFNNSKALLGVMDLLGKNLGSTEKIFHNLNNSTGITAEAFKELEQSASFQLQKSLESLKLLFVEVGSVLLSAFLPAIKSIGKAIQTLATGFNKLSPQMKSFGVTIGIVVAALPLLLSLAGSLVSVLGAILSPVGLVVAGLSAIAYVIYNEWSSIKTILVNITNYFIDLYNESFAFRLIIEGLAGIFKAMFTIASSAFNSLWNIIQGFTKNIIEGFKNIGKVIKGVFTLDADLIQEGLTGIKDAVFENLQQIGTEGLKHVQNSMSALGTELPKAFEKAYKKDPISKITEDDIDNLTNNLKGKLSGIAGMFSTSIGGGGGGGEITNQSRGVQKTQEIKAGDTSPLSGLSEKTKELSVQGELYKSKAQEFVNSAANIIQEGTVNTLSNMAAGIGEMLSGAGGGMGDFSTMLMSGIADMAIKLGKLAIATGISIKAIKEALAKLHPAVAIVAGIALVALGSAVKGQMKSMSGGGGGGGGVPAFANGGIVSGPTLGLMGEYSGAKSNPEVIAPLNKLEGMIGQKQTNVNVGGNFRIQGQDLVLALQKADKQRNRII